MRNMLKIAPLAATFLMLGAPAYATPTIEFTGGVIGSSGINLGANSSATGDMAIDTMIVSGDGAHDGTYAVTGGFGGYGELKFDTVAETITLVGGVTSLSIPDTTLFTGTGPFGDLSVTDLACTGVPSHQCPVVSFDTTDTKDPSLLSALGISFNEWDLSSRYTADGTGNTFPQTSADALNTQVPEPATLLLLGSGLAGLALFRRRRRASVAVLQGC